MSGCRELSHPRIGKCFVIIVGAIHGLNAAALAQRPTATDYNSI
jgi:hypothetical protein